MSQFLSQLPKQLLQQQQRLTPQLIQAMDILQLNALALEERIQQELDGNPALELAGGDEPDADRNGDTRDRELADGERSMVVGEGSGEEFDRLDTLVREYDWLDEDSEYRGTTSRARRLEESDNKLEAMQNTVARPVSLQEYLLDQWRLTEADPATMALGTQIIADLDARGWLPTPLPELAAAVDPPASVAQVKDALAKVQLLDPPGIAARDLRECLLLQLEAAGDDVELAIRIVEEQFENLQKNRLPQVAKALDVELDDVKEALHQIARLSMHPGLDVTGSSAPPVVPDVSVEFDEDADEYVVRLTRGNQRDLRISDEFREALERSRGDKKSRDFIKQKIEAAAAIIDAIQFRRNRLLEVAKAVVKAQRDFLDQGEQHLKVLRMSDLAAEFGCDPSTISRTVDEKWIQTPRGIYPLRRFFTGGTESGSGEALGWDSIKAKVQEIVDHEDKASPLSDDEIVTRLQREGVEIKRRTVAKYRAQLGIPTARQRRQF